MRYSSDVPLIPKISIVVPSFNQAAYLKDALDSILSQRYPNLELIVIDGGSTDESVSILQSYSSFLDYWCSEPDEGHGDAILKGFERSSGEIMAWLNSDDAYFSWSFAAVSNLFATFPNVEWITGRGVVRNQEGLPLKEEHDRKNMFSYLVGDFGWIQQESTFWRRSLWVRSKNDISMYVSKKLLMVDSIFWCIFFRSSRLYNADVFLGSYRQHLDNRAHVNAVQCVAETRMLIKNILWHDLPSLLRFKVLLYRCLRQFLSIYFVRKVVNPCTVQKLAFYIFSPPPVDVITYDRDKSCWALVRDPFLFKLYRPHPFSAFVSRAVLFLGAPRHH
jgi:glycosyltransferase involved in cell wall biosynthesis